MTPRPLPALAVLGAVLLCGLAALPAEAQTAPTVTQAPNGNVLLTMPKTQYFRVDCTDVGSFYSGLMLGNYNPITWQPFGRGTASGNNASTIASPWVHQYNEGQGDLPIDVEGALIAIHDAPTQGSYLVYQLRTPQIPSSLPEPILSGVFDRAPVVNGRDRDLNLTLDVPLDDGAGVYVHIILNDRFGRPQYSIFSSNQGVARYSDGPSAALFPYGHLKDQGKVGTLINSHPSSMTDFETSDSATMRVAVGDVVEVQPTGSVDGQSLHSTHPHVVRYGSGAAPAANFGHLTTAGTAAIPTPAGVVNTYRPLYDITGFDADPSGAQIFIPKNYFYTATSPLSCSVFTPEVDPSGGELDWGTGTAFSLAFTRAAAAGTDITPTAGLYTGVLSAEADRTVVVPGTRGTLVIGTIQAPIFPDGVEPPDPITTTFLDANSAAMVVTYLGQQYYTINIPKTFASSVRCTMTPDLHSFPTAPPLFRLGSHNLPHPHDPQDVGQHWHFQWLQDWPGYVADDPSTWDNSKRVGIQSVRGVYDLSCIATKASDGTEVRGVKQITINKGPFSTLNHDSGVTQFITAYQDNELGWGGSDFLGIGLVGAMGVMSAMVGFSRKNIPASAVLFAIVIGALGWFGLMTVTETMMSAITVCVILIVFQRSGGK